MSSANLPPVQSLLKQEVSTTNLLTSKFVTPVAAATRVQLLFEYLLKFATAPGVLLASAKQVSQQTCSRPPPAHRATR